MPAESSNIATLRGQAQKCAQDEKRCEGYAEHLNYVEQARVSGKMVCLCCFVLCHADPEQQAFDYATAVRAAFPNYELTMTGHSLGGVERIKCTLQLAPTRAFLGVLLCFKCPVRSGLLAIVTAYRMGLKALTFAPTPFHNVLKQEIVEFLKMMPSCFMGVCRGYPW